MKTVHRLALLSFLGLMFASACNEVDKANALVKEANKKIDAYNVDASALSKKHAQFQEMIKNGKLESDPASLKTQGQEVVAAYQALSIRCKEIADKFDAASKLKVNQKLKQYWSLKAQVFQKRNDILTANQDKIQSILDGMAKNDMSQVESRLDKDNANIDAWDKMATDLEQQGEKMIQQNPDIFEK